MINVLFVCSGNSCRSRIMESWLCALAGNRITADFAGIEVHGRNDRVVAAMAAAGMITWFDGNRSEAAPS